MTFLGQSFELYVSNNRPKDPTIKKNLIVFLFRREFASYFEAVIAKNVLNLIRSGSAIFDGNCTIYSNTVQQNCNPFSLNWCYILHLHRRGSNGTLVEAKYTLWTPECSYSSFNKYPIYPFNMCPKFSTNCDVTYYSASGN